MSEMVERVARAIANGLGDEFDNAFNGKSDWIYARGEKGGRFRDCNEPTQDDYLGAARAAIEAMREPTDEMIEAGLKHQVHTVENSRASTFVRWSWMVDAALGDG
jgi:hypothetical protein